MILAKVVSWRICSILITLATTFVWTGSVTSATGFTVCLHALLVTAHWIFENTWERYEAGKRSRT